MTMEMVPVSTLATIVKDSKEADSFVLASDSCCLSWVLLSGLVSSAHIFVAGSSVLLFPWRAVWWALRRPGLSLM